MLRHCTYKNNTQTRLRCSKYHAYEFWSFSQNYYTHVHKIHKPHAKFNPYQSKGLEINTHINKQKANIKLYIETTLCNPWSDRVYNVDHITHNLWLAQFVRNQLYTEIEKHIPRFYLRWVFITWPQMHMHMRCILRRTKRSALALYNNVHSEMHSHGHKKCTPACVDYVSDRVISLWRWWWLCKTRAIRNN